MADVSGDMFAISGSDLCSDVTKMAVSLWQSHDYADLDLKLTSGQVFRAHKFVVAARSKFFRQKLTESSSDCIENLEFDEVCFHQILQFIYTDNVKVRKAGLHKPANAAKLLGVDSLYKKCLGIQMSVVADITPDNCLKIWGIATDIGDKKLIKKAKPLSLKNFVFLQHSADFKSLS